MKTLAKETKPKTVFHLNFSEFSKASPEAIGCILEALNREMSEALHQRRLPLLEKAFEHLGNFPKIMM